MGTQDLFVYLVIAALATPVVWVTWWALGSVANRQARPLTAPHVSQPRAPAYAFPTAVDMSLPTRGKTVTVYSSAGAEIEGCEGPDAAGRCPRALADGTVPCAGHLLALPQPIRGSFEWQIPAGYKSCLLGSYAVFRQKEVSRQSAIEGIPTGG